MEKQQPAELKQSVRLKQIMAVMRKYHFISNFYHQREPETICGALQELGPTFIKLGQILSTRPDLVSGDYVKALRKLQDQVKADPFSSVEHTFETATGKSLSAVFKQFEPEPFASASIGQVHHAQLLDGTPVVVKVQHPAITQLVSTDLALLRRAIKMIKYVPAKTAVVDLDRTLEEVSSSLLSEIDTLHEAKNGEEFYRLNNKQGIFIVPEVYRSFCAPQVLVNQAMTGKSIRYFFNATTAEEQERNHLLATALVHNFMKQVFVDHFFHADPHPGNLLVTPAPAGEMTTSKTVTHEFKQTSITYQQQTPLPPYRLVYLDFGMMGRLTPVIADGIAEVILALTSKDYHRIAQTTLAICNQTGELDQQRFTRELSTFLRPYLAQGLGQIDFSNMLYRIIQLCEENNLQIKPEVTLLIKAFGTLEATIARLDPQLSMMAVARPFGLAYLKRKLKVRDLADDAVFKLWSVLDSAGQLPERLDTALDTFNGGGIEVKLRYEGQRQLLKQVERIANRLLVVIILAAVILSSSMLVESSISHPHIYRLGVVGYAIAIGIIVILVVSEVWHRVRRWRNNRK